MKTAEITKLDGMKLYKTRQSSPDKLIVDVRSPLEYHSEHIEGSINLPIEQLVDRSRELPLDADIVFVCRTGIRAKRAAVIAKDAGLGSMVLEGGIMKWKKNQLPLITGQQRLPVDRQVQLTIGVGILSSLGLGLLVDKRFLSLAAIFGAGLTFAGLSGTCGLASLLEKAPWNQLDEDSKKSCSS